MCYCWNRCLRQRVDRVGWAPHGCACLVRGTAV